MKELLKKYWFVSVLILGLMLITFFMNLWVMSLKLNWPNSDETLWSLSRDLSPGNYTNIFSFVFVITFYLSIIPILLSLFSYFKKNHWGFVISLIYFLSFSTGLIVFQSSYGVLSSFALVLVIMSIIIIILMFALLILRKVIISKNLKHQVSEKELMLKETKIPLHVLWINIISLLVFLTTFFIPLYQMIESDQTTYTIIIGVLFSSNTSIEAIAYFLANFVIFLGVFLYFAHSLTHYFYNKEIFISKSKTLITFIFLATLAFFITGLVVDIYYTLLGNTVHTISFIPMLLMCIMIFVYSVFKGKYDAFNQTLYLSKESKYPKIEPLIYVFLLSAISVLVLLFKLIIIEITFGSLTYSVELTGLTLLRDYTILDHGYRIVAFILVVMLISVGLGLVLAISSYLSKYRFFNSIVKFVATINLFFVFILAVSGYYFQIAQAINIVVIMDIFEHYGFSLPDIFEFDYKISSDAIYALIATTIILIIMFARKAFDRDEEMLLENIEPSHIKIDSASDEPSKLTDDIIDDEAFDPCPAFSNIDSRIEDFNLDLENRKTQQTTHQSLNELINFVVDYARNSRLHLSYTPEDIATFVAGLGASKLSILQGMSGTGKTSLPKIFSEAIFGNCEIIEVESSWKDKNELLGYYNEFSMKYTPKKFTLALYKAALNQEVITFILLDEMNLSRIEYYFSDFLSLMENEEDKREIKLINIELHRKVDNQTIDYLALDHKNTLKVPPNVWFIGTANRDESTFVISDKVYDRSHTMNFTKRAPKVRNYSNPLSQQYYDYQTLNNLFKKAKEKGTFDAEHSELIRSVEALLAPYNISFGNRILNQIEDFVNIYKECFSNEDVEHEAIERILLSKVVSKLEVKTIDDKEKLESDFEKLKLHHCAAFINCLDNE